MLEPGRIGNRQRVRQELVGAFGRRHMRKGEMTIELSKEKQEKLQNSIKRFFDEVLEEDIGDLRASLVLDFCLKEIGPTIYNKAVADAQVFMQERIADLDATCYQTEFGYWKD
jgi:uncharacterized protein (DUF2164 family)